MEVDVHIFINNSKVYVSTAKIVNFATQSYGLQFMNLRTCTCESVEVLRAKYHQTEEGTIANCGKTLHFCMQVNSLLNNKVWLSSPFQVAGLGRSTSTQ